MRISEYPVGTMFSDEEVDAVSRVLKSGVALTRGPDCDLFEEEFASYCGAKHAIATSSCGAALNITSKILHLGEEDEVICQANSFWITINHLVERGVKIVCADIDPDSLNIDPDSVQRLITKKTKAIYVVHHGGNPANLTKIRSVAADHNIVVVEDAAHAVGAEHDGKKIGCDSDLACFSFSTLKNMSTLGEGGMIVTNNDEFAELAKGFRTNFPSGTKKARNNEKLGEFRKSGSSYLNMGDAWDFDWVRLEEVGSTYRMSTVQAAVGRVQLKKLDSLIEKRTEIAMRYNEVISAVPGFETLEVLPNSKHAWHLFTFFVRAHSKYDRAEVLRVLQEEKSIDLVLRFFPINLNGILRMRGCRPGGCIKCGSLEKVEHSWFKEQMALPISPQLTTEEVDYVCDSLAVFGQ